MDACGGVGATTGAVALRSGPGDRHGGVEQLGSGAQVYMCDTSPDEKWVGIVAIPAGDGADCGVSSPIAQRQAYDGSCRSGWVPADSVTLIAG